VSTITVKPQYDDVADYHSVYAKVIRDKNPVRKQGVSDYFIHCVMWYGEWCYFANIETCWPIDTSKEFETLRDASDWIRRYVY